VFYLEDGEWECSCPNSEDTCAHVAAAAIALGQARKEGSQLPVSQKGAGKVVYRFSRADGGPGLALALALALDRVIVRPGAAGSSEIRIDTTLAPHMASGAVEPEQADLNVDRLLGARARGAL